MNTLPKLGELNGFKMNPLEFEKVRFLRDEEGGRGLAAWGGGEGGV